MGVVEAGRDESALQVHDLGALAGPTAHVGVAPDGGQHVAAHGQRGRRRSPRIAGPDSAIHEDAIGIDRRRRRAAHRGDQEQRSDEDRPHGFAGFVKASMESAASRAATARFSSASASAYSRRNATSSARCSRPSAPRAAPRMTRLRSPASSRSRAGSRGIVRRCGDPSVERGLPEMARVARVHVSLEHGAEARVFQFAQPLDRAELERIPPGRRRGRAGARGTPGRPRPAASRLRPRPPPPRPARRRSRPSVAARHPRQRPPPGEAVSHRAAGARVGVRRRADERAPPPPRRPCAPGRRRPPGAAPSARGDRRGSRPARQRLRGAARTARRSRGPPAASRPGRSRRAGAGPPRAAAPAGSRSPASRPCRRRRTTDGRPRAATPASTIRRWSPRARARRPRSPPRPAPADGTRSRKAGRRAPAGC